MVLFSIGLLFFLSNLRRSVLLAALVAASASAVATERGWLTSICALETNYFCIKVEDWDHGGEPVRVLILDRLVHSYTSLDDPTELVYVYEQMYAEATAYLARRGSPLRTLFIGGGGYTFPRYMEAIYPDSQLDVIEIDPGVTQIAYEKLGLSQDTTIVTYNEDARTFLERAQNQTYDLILGDAFNDYSVPYHLTTKDFNDRARAWLADDGLYIVNIIDGPSGDFLRSYVHTMRKTFRHVYVVPTNESWRKLFRSTFVIIGTDEPLKLGALRPMDGYFGLSLIRHSVLADVEVEHLLAAGRPVLLTDQYAPVDQMLAPVFRGQDQDEPDQE
jgi:spermidine synthase